jgi:hypothetical protein
MDKNVFLSLLSLDSYNRIYGRRVKVDLRQNGASKIGDALIQLRTYEQSPLMANWESTDFYASDYVITGNARVESFSEGDKIISYRGTDILRRDFWSFGLAVGDPYNIGFTNLLGNSYGDNIGLTVDFYRSVVGSGNEFTDGAATLTGHSLGGGLAGYVTALYGQKGYLVDNMTFNATVARTFNDASGSPDPNSKEGQLKALVYGDGAVVAADYQGLSASAVTGEFLEALLQARRYQTPRVNYIDSNAGFPSNPINLHSVALHTLLLWAIVKEETDWISAGPQLWSAYFDQKVAISLGADITKLVGENGDEGAVLNHMIAYSALDAEYDNDAKPFGDTGIWSMFNDAGDLGAVLADAPTAFFGQTIIRTPSILSPLATKDAKQFLADALVQYAGALALYDREDGATADYDVRKGVLELGSDILTFDASKNLWKDALGQENKLVPLNLEAFRDAFFNQADPSLFNKIKKWTRIGSIDELAALGWGVTNAGIFDRYHIRTKDSSNGDINLDARDYDTALTRGDAAQVDVYIAGEGDNSIVGTDGHDLIIGGGGGDSVDGGDGDDVVIGGDGDDTLKGGSGRNFIVGGDGAQDRLIYGNLGVGQGYNLNLLLAPDLSGRGASFANNLLAQAVITSVGADGNIEDTLIGVENLQLTRFADVVNVGKEGFGLLSDTLTIDLSNAEGGNQDSDDFDTISFLPRDGLLSGQNGVFWYNSSIQTALPYAIEVYDAAYFTGPATPWLLQAGLSLESLLPDDALTFKGAENVVLTDLDDRFAFTSGDYSAHSGYGRISAGAGRDVLYFVGARSTNEAAPPPTNGDGFQGGGGSFGGGGASGSYGDPVSANNDLQLKIDGGEGDDYIFANDGDRAVTIGGLGRDWIYNTSAGGIIWGDIENSLTRADGSRFAVLDGQTVEIADDKSNADTFWFASDVTIMDAQGADRLKLYGITLTGGDTTATTAALTLGAFNPLFGAEVAGAAAGNDNEYNVWPQRAYGLSGWRVAA